MVKEIDIKIQNRYTSFFSTIEIGNFAHEIAVKIANDYVMNFPEVPIEFIDDFVISFRYGKNEKEKKVIKVCFMISKENDVFDTMGNIKKILWGLQDRFDELSKLQKDLGLLGMHDVK